MNPITIVWPSLLDYEAIIVSSSAVTASVPLPLNVNSAIPDSTVSVQGYVPGNLVPPYADGPRYGMMPNLGTGAQLSTYEMPLYNVRSISITAATGSLGTTEFQVNGLDQNGSFITTTGTPAVVELTFFKTIISIIPQATLAGGNTVQVGLGADGFIPVLKMDTWNKNNNYTISYNEATESMSVTPYFTTDKLVPPYPTLYSNPGVFYELPVNNVNIIVSPSSATTLPVTGSASFSVVGIPLTGLTTKVTDTTGVFYVTIIQQGGLV